MAVPSLVSLMIAYFGSYVMSSQVLRVILGTNTQLFLKHGRDCWQQRSQHHGGMMFLNVIKHDARVSSEYIYIYWFHLEFIKCRVIFL